MKHSISLIIGSALLALPFMVQSVLAVGSNNRYDFTDFNKVSISSGMELSVTQSKSFDIQVNGSADDLKDLKVEKKGQTLRFYIEKKGWFHDHNISIKIGMPVLTELDLSGGSQATISLNQPEESFACDLSGGSTIDGEITCKQTEIGASGGSEVELSGQGGDLEVSGSGGSEFHLEKFQVRNVEADLSGGSELHIAMNGILNVDASGGSEVTFSGKAEYGDTNMSGGSEIKKSR
ncbi:MAG: DUF2807 domain-containing protein [Candidatus Delongbacteria bacterium]|nr:DUF2807 domain-containing protein [Candidatus Delongbacteria bacterium]